MEEYLLQGVGAGQCFDGLHSGIAQKFQDRREAFTTVLHGDVAVGFQFAGALVRAEDFQHALVFALHHQLGKARAANQQMQDYLDGLYRHGELVISHPEGTRYQDELGPLQKEVVEHLVQAEERLGLRVPLIPIGLEYESYARPRSPVYFRVDEPLYADDFADISALMNHLDERLRVLSGLA